MTASQNGWRIIDRAECATIDVPGGQLAVHPKLAVIFADLAAQYHATVEPLQWPGCWGHAVRPIKGSKLFSNHSSGTAVDFCAPQHPQGVKPGITFTTRELDAVKVLEDRYGGVLEWGGRWRGDSVDAMHWEVSAAVTVAQVDELAARLSGTPGPTPGPSPAPAPAPTGWTGPDLTGTGFGLRGDVGDNGPRVAALQAFFRDRYPAYAKALAADGWWGPLTTAVVAEFATRSGVRGADGLNVGPQLARKLYLAGFRA